MNRTIVHLLRALVSAGLLSAAIHSQVFISPNPLCFGFNETAASPPTCYFSLLSVSGPLAIGFTAPMSTTVDTLEIFEWPPLGGGVTGGVHAIDMLTGLPTSSSLGTLGSITPQLPTHIDCNWYRRPIVPPVALVGGTSYALVLAGTCRLIWEPGGASPLPYLLPSPACGGWCAPAFLPFKIRFRGGICGPGPPASAAPVGTACPQPPSALLFATAPPVLGTSNYTLVLFTGQAMPPNPLGIFWSLGINGAGTPIAPGSPCLSYLDQASFAVLASAGLEPGIVGTTSTSSYSFAIPFDPGLAGVSVGLQAAVIDPLGVPRGQPGIAVTLSNAYELILGY